MKINKKIECPNCEIKGYVKVRRKGCVSHKGKSWVRKQCTKCGFKFEK